MNKKTIARVVFLACMMGVSTSSMAAANQAGSSQANISGSFVASTCTVTQWPSDINFDPISMSDWNTYSHSQKYQVKGQGNFVLANCPAQTQMKYTVTADDLAQGNPLQALARTADGKLIQGMGISFSATENFASEWYLDGREANLGSTNDQGGLTVPAYVALVKRAGPLMADGKQWNGGAFNTIIRYTVSYD